MSTIRSAANGSVAGEVGLANSNNIESPSLAAYEGDCSETHESNGRDDARKRCAGKRCARPWRAPFIDHAVKRKFSRVLDALLRNSDRKSVV